MKVVRDFPPLFDEINAAFNVRGKDVIFAWGDTIYNPRGIDIHPSLIDHEATHGQRQGIDIAGWWRRYIDDDHFRLIEEAAGHRAEYLWWMTHGNRKEKRAALKKTAARLAAPLYGGLVTQTQAKVVIKESEGLQRRCISKVDGIPDHIIRSVF